MRKKDLIIGIIIGLLIGILILPLIKIAQPYLYKSIKLVVLLIFILGTPLGLFVAYLLSKKIAVIWQFAKFGVVGVLNTLVDWGVLAFLPLLFGIAFNVPLVLIGSLTLTYYSLYKAVSFLVSVINSYFWNKYWVFEGREAAIYKEFTQFLVISGIGFLINVLLASVAFIAISGIGLFNEGQVGILSAALATAVSMVWNFVGYKFFVFKK